jgi:three-Cys-motif partner protein
MQVLNGDANALIKEIVAEVPERTLSLVFLDPYSLELDFATVRQLATRRADLIIFFPDRLDILRNQGVYYRSNPQSNLDRVLGPNVDWRAMTKDQAGVQLLETFRNIYRQQLATLGYAHFGRETIHNANRPLYSLMFCSKSRVGADIWHRTSLKKPDGQHSFDFEH